MRKYSIIIPVYNRPDEIDELLESLTRQTFQYFEVIIVEDGSADTCESVVEKYRSQLDIHYYFKENTGQGFSRNFGYGKSSGDYFIVFDSDCLIPEHYMQTVDDYLNQNYLDAYGGPDMAHKDFTAMQKAISYSMTSLFTTGGIRGNKKHAGRFHARSFNMGLLREVFEKTGGYVITRMGEDIEFSIRIINSGFSLGLIEDAFVYHKRRTSLLQFWKQLHFFGRARINVRRFFSNELKLVHMLPVAFVFALLLWLISYFILPYWFEIGAYALGAYYLLIFVDSALKNKSLYVGLLSVATSFVQLMAYGIGFLKEMVFGREAEG